MMRRLDTAPPAGYPRVGWFLRDTREKMGLSRTRAAELVEQVTGKSIGAKTIEEYELGEGKTGDGYRYGFPERMVRLARTLGWAEGSLTTVLGGGDPEIASARVPAQPAIGMGPMTRDEKDMLLMAVRTNPVFSEEWKVKLSETVERQPVVDDGASDTAS